MESTKPLLFTPIKIKNLELKNRIVMSPMCMHKATDEGHVTDWLKTHYSARALGQAGLIFIESLAVNPHGMIGPNDLGIWSDEHVTGLKGLVDLIHTFGSKVAAQISHAGRQSFVPEGKNYDRLAPSAIPFGEGFPTPKEMTLEEIENLIKEFGAAAKRVKQAGFDVLEIHTAHGYMLNEFLSPLANQRTDQYGGSMENRYRIVSEIIKEVKQHWNGPLFLRISSSDYMEGGNTPETFVTYTQWMKKDGIDFIDCSSGGIAPVKVNTFANYQVPAAELIRKKVNIMTSGVGLIERGKQAEEILRNERADLIFVGRAILRDPFWARTAAVELGTEIEVPVSYTRYGSNWLLP